MGEAGGPDILRKRPHFLDHLPARPGRILEECGVAVHRLYDLRDQEVEEQVRAALNELHIVHAAVTRYAIGYDGNKRGAMAECCLGEEIEARKNLSGYPPVPGIPEKLHFRRVIRILRIGSSLSHLRLPGLLPRRRLLGLLRHAVVFQTQTERPARWSWRRVRSLHLTALRDR